MRKYNFVKGGKVYSIAINHTKYLCGSNYELKYSIMNILRQNLSKTELSEYQEEINKSISVNVDENPLKRNTILFEVNQFYDLSVDLKMQAKSLIAKYYETYLNANVYFDIISTINSLFECLSNQINSNKNCMYANFNEINNKHLIKMLNPSLIKEELYCNQYDFNYEELILFQLRLITYIVTNNPTLNYIVIIDVPKLTTKIINHIPSLENLSSFVLIDKVEKVNIIEDYCICNSYLVDLADEQFIYENIFEQLPIYIELQEVYELMKLILKNEINMRTKYITDLLE